MKKTRIIFFDIKDYDREFFEKYGKNYNFEMSFFKSRLSLENVHLTKGYDVVCAFTNDDIGKETIDAMAENGVRLLAMRCAGFNNVSLKDIHNRFKVVRVPAYSPHAIAEYTVGLILAVNRKINKAYVRTREGNFSINGLMGVDLYGKTAGIIGTGKIGQILIKILKGFDMKVIAYDLFPNQKVAEELGFEYVSLDELYANSDIISLNCPLTKDTQYMINRRSMLKMKDGVILVNTGRGQLIDSADLVEALKDKKVGAVALDVYEEEEDYFFEDKSTQVIEDDILGRLLSFYNVLITSHQAYFTKEAVEAITVTTLNNIKDFVEDKPLVNEVPQN
ncbi:hydroxyacid dehydrogenase [Fusobacterium hwasookii ChDC F174]|uniref:Hydroxyacid dehydrogenase n=1 Tax=Fusobacterium hwasookii ChDC F174 TaxID=1307442 RepID=A0A0S2ZM59_9FUSO|nr:2-hydroxyacid dehydrogenase [Fusobacterium hwasookii]ALQ39995.1 hydroxyacid dehydrogenase [Fusobacterium hwasookii ChDC F174]